MSGDSGPRATSQDDFVIVEIRREVVSGRGDPPIAVADLTPNSENHKLGGERDYLPVSFSVSPDDAIVAKHWQAVEEGARRSHRTPDRRQWRTVRDVFVAPTDEEARALAVDGAMGRTWTEFLLPVPDSDMTLSYLADQLWFVGSPSTVADKVIALQQLTGGFGYLLTAAYDYGSQSEIWARSQELMAKDVLPRVQKALGENVP